MIPLSNCVLGCVGRCVLYVKLGANFFCNEIGNLLGLCVNSELLKRMGSFVKASNGVLINQFDIGDIKVHLPQCSEMVQFLIANCLFN